MGSGKGGKKESGKKESGKKYSGKKGTTAPTDVATSGEKILEKVVGGIFDKRGGDKPVTETSAPTGKKSGKGGKKESGKKYSGKKGTTAPTDMATSGEKKLEKVVGGILGKDRLDFDDKPADNPTGILD